MRPESLWSTRRSALALALAVALIPAAAVAAPKVELWERWTAHDPAASQRIDHGAWGRFLRAYLSEDEAGVTRVDYAAVSPADRAPLGRYIDRLAGVPISRYSRPEQLAYWINLYNALTVKLVLDHYPVDSILDLSISPGWFSFGPWGKKLIAVEGEELSLDDIEHRILRPIWRDPRIHYAVNCAAVGCPNLRMTAFTADNADDLLTRGAREYVNHERGARFVDGRLIVSSIYEWFQEDFGDSEAGVIAHLRDYAEGALAERLARATFIAGDEYDWALNDARAR